MPSQALLSRYLRAELGPSCCFWRHTEMPGWVSPAHTSEGSPRPTATRGQQAGASSAAILCTDARVKANGTVALMLNSDLDWRQGFRGSWSPCLSGAGSRGLFPRPAHVAGVRRGGWGGQALNKPERWAWPQTPRRARCPARVGGHGEALARVLAFASRMWESATGVPRPLWWALSGVTRINCPGQVFSRHTSEAEPATCA